MAGLTVQLFTSQLIEPGQTHHLIWNEFLPGRVWWFSLDIRATKYEIPFAPFVLKVEVTNIEYRLNFQSIANQTREAHVWLKNTGEMEAIYDMNVAFAPSAGPALASASVTPYWGAALGSVNTSWTGYSVQTFPFPRNLVAFPALRLVEETDDQTNTHAYISSYVDGGKTKTGPFPQITGTAVTQIVWALDTTDSVNDPLRVVYFFE